MSDRAAASSEPAPDAATRRILGALLRGEQAWDATLADSIAGHLGWLARHGLMPLVARAARAAGADWTGPLADAGARLDAAARELAARELAIAGPLRDALLAMTTRGIGVLVFKGEALAAQVYPAPGLRERGDVDLWVAATDFDDAGACLQGAGFTVVPAADGHLVQTERSYRHARVTQLVLDLHRAAFGQAQLDAALPFASVYAMAEPHGDTGARRPDAADALVIAALHRIAHHADGSDRALWLYDVDLLARRFPGAVPLACARATDGGVAALLGATLADARSLWQTPIGNDALVALAARAPVEPSAALLHATAPLARAWHDWRALPGPRDRIAFLREHVLPPLRFMRSRYPRVPVWLLPLVYPWRALRGVVRAAFGR